MTKLLLGITDQGLGHLAQSAPIVAELRRRRPDMQFSVRTGLPRIAVERRITPPFDLVPAEEDFGVVMGPSFEVDGAATYERYLALHGDYDQNVDRLARWLVAERYDGVLTNVSYLLLAAAREAGLPSLAMSSLNWLDMFNRYCSEFERSDEIFAQIRDSYSTSVFCRLTPGMPMPGLKTVPIQETIAVRGVNRRSELCRAFKLSVDARIVVFAFGGLHAVTPPRWRAATGAGHLIFGPTPWCAEGTPWHDPEQAGMAFADLLASADLVITKAGYGVITELAAAGVPALLVGRDWPEAPHLVEWLGRYVPYNYLDGPLAELEFAVVLDWCHKMASGRTESRPTLGGEASVAALVLEQLV